VIGRFTEEVKLDRFAIYVFDYGAPVGFRLATAHPERITAIISQNEMPMKEVSVKDGILYNDIGKTLPRRIVRR
jgi:hypothetical protein